jgi:hypothetical protein
VPWCLGALVVKSQGWLRLGVCRVRHRTYYNPFQNRIPMSS